MEMHIIEVTISQLTAVENRRPIHYVFGEVFEKVRECRLGGGEDASIPRLRSCGITLGWGIAL